MSPSSGASPRGTLLITGGTRGIGAAVAVSAARAGWGVCVTYSHARGEADAIVQRIGDSGGRVTALCADVADPDAASRMFDHAEQSLGPVTALVNNAGITGPLGPFVDSSPDDMRRILDVNVLGVLMVSQQAVRGWLDGGTGGSIVNISSVAAATGSPGEYIAYAGSKAAVETITVGLAREVAADGIRVNAVSPGTTQTGIHAAAGDALRPERVASRIPMGRVGQPEEIASAVMWLHSDEASYVTGAVLRVAGGL